MKCSARSTTLSASRAIVALALVLAASTATAHAPVDCASGVAAAICAAVEARVGGDAEVAISGLEVRLVREAADIEARPVPGARLGRPARFLLFDRAGLRVGEAQATLQVTRTVARVAAPIARGAVVEAGALSVQAEALGETPIVPVPAPDAVIGARARRDLVPGELLTQALVRVDPLVVSGRAVTIVARIGGVTVEGQAVAAQDGALGDVIRVVNPDSRRPLRGRVVEGGRVEVMYEP